ncbi:MAG: hypothetical protein ABI430_03885 [Candidatus Taylorbacteria bacterium]
MPEKKFNIGVIGTNDDAWKNLVRLVRNHPQFGLTYLVDATSRKYNQTPPSGLDLIFISLPPDASPAFVDKIGPRTRIVDLGTDFCGENTEWVDGLADIYPDRIRGQTRVIVPGCYFTGALIALAPILVPKKMEWRHENLISHSSSGVTGADISSETDEQSAGHSKVASDCSNVDHFHAKEMGRLIECLSGGCQDSSPKSHSPLIHLSSVNLTTCFLEGSLDAEVCFGLAQDFYKNNPLVRVSIRPAHKEKVDGSNLAVISYASPPQETVAFSSIARHGKGGAGHAIQNANLMLGLEANMGLTGAIVAPKS